jgi:hypothetical protein
LLIPRLGFPWKNKQSPRAMKRFKNLDQVLLALLLLSVAQAALAVGVALSSMATLSRRSAKPGDHLELVVTVRAASHPKVVLPQTLPELQIHLRRKPQHLMVDDESVWLFRYRVTPKQIGDYQIPPLQIIDGNSWLETKPVFLHVSQKGELPPLSAKELALGVNISDTLSQEVLKSAPQPTPQPTPSPTPRDTRAFGVRAISSCWHALKAFWNYPGK